MPFASDSNFNFKAAYFFIQITSAIYFCLKANLQEKVVLFQSQYSIFFFFNQPYIEHPAFHFLKLKH